ncbi:MAG: multidrug efflux protein [Gammaproteobacteria bacterium]|nr:multidrug efflux protein [Gammaproteobacteria bacterium]
MSITDYFLKKPVISMSINLMILCIGLFSCFKLPIRQFPKMSTAVININTAYPGAGSHLVAGLVTSTLENAIANAEGLDYITSQSSKGMSSITVHLKLNADSQTVLLDIINKVQAVTNLLPPAAMKPVIDKKSDSATPLMYISLKSPTLTPQSMTDYAFRVIQPQLSNLDGVAKIDIIGGQKYALRIAIHPDQLMAHHLSENDVVTALNNNQFLTTAGEIKNHFIATPLITNTDLHQLDDFKKLNLTCPDGSIIRLDDVAKISLGAENYDSEARFDGQKAIFLAVTPTPTANPLIVIEDVRQNLPILQSQFPPNLSATVVYDATKYIKEALHEVVTTLIEAVLIVIGVIYLFLGSWRTVLIPIITIPFSLISMATVLYATGCSINLLTLLAFVLAIGLVVDDAIVVVENIHRHFERSQNIWTACLQGSAEICKPVIGMTITLAAVFAPIAFSVGLTGSLFKEFALTLAGTVILSGFIALTLSPLLNSKLITSNQHQQGSRLFLLFQQQLTRLESRYITKLSDILQHKQVALLLIGFSLILSLVLYQYSAHEIAPEEDQGFFFMISSGQAQATKIANRPYIQEMESIFKKISAMEHYFVINSASPIAGLVLKPWKKRDVTQFKLKTPLQQDLNHITGLNTFAIIPSALPGGGDGPPFQMVLQSYGDIKELVQKADDVLNEAKKTGLFIFIDSTLKINETQYEIQINREKAALMGFTMSQIGQVLSSSLANGQVNYFSMDDKRYNIIPQLKSVHRAYVSQLNELSLINPQKQLVPLANLIELKPLYEPNNIPHFQQANAATIQGVLLPGVPMGKAINELQAIAKKHVPQQYRIDFGGQARQFLQEQSSLFPIFMLALITIYLVLACQYNSFRDPLIILTSLPLTLCAALLPVFLGLCSINIYTQIALLTLVGLISKHGILIVDFANEVKIKEGLDVKAAVMKAAQMRMRPILMTTGAMIFGVLPMIFASGAGAQSRIAMGIIIAFGMGIGTLFTLFIVPCMYCFISAPILKKEWVPSVCDA